MSTWMRALRLATATDLDTIYTWFARPSVADPLYVVRPVSRADLAGGRLNICDAEDAETVTARFVAIDWQSTLAGFAVDYGWDFADDPVRELDLALPGPHPRTGWFLLRTMAYLAEMEFRELGATYIRVAVPERDPRHLDAMYARLGARFEGELTARHPSSGELRTRRIYGVDHASFYASPLAIRLGFAAGR